MTIRFDAMTLMDDADDSTGRRETERERERERETILVMLMMMMGSGGEWGKGAP
jgi:hypothetical protein